MATKNKVKFNDVVIIYYIDYIYDRTNFDIIDKFRFRQRIIDFEPLFILVLLKRNRSNFINVISLTIKS